MILASDSHRYWRALEDGDAGAATGLVVELREAGHSVDEVLSEVVMPAQDRIGALWATNEWTVAQEHNATAVSEVIVEQLALGTPAPLPGAPRVLVACIEQEWHALPGLVVSVLLREWGCSVEYLGANVSAGSLVAAIVEHKPDAVMLSTSLSSSLVRCSSFVHIAQQQGVPVIVGGRAFDPGGVRADALGAWGYAASVHGAHELLGRVPETYAAAVRAPNPAAEEAEAIQSERSALAHEITREADAALGVTGGGEDAVGPRDWRVVLATHVPHVVGCVAGALLTDDPTVLSEVRSWLDEVLVSRGAPADATDVVWDVLSRRLAAYPQAAALLA